MKKFLKIFMFALAGAALAACSGDDEKKNTKLLTFHVANDRTISSGLTRENVTMPFSGFTVLMNKDQFMYTGDIRKINLAQVTLIDGPITGFLFTCNDRGRRRLMQATAANMGGYIVVMYGGKPIALRKIDSAISDGALFAHIEIPKDKDVAKFYEELSKSVETVEEIKRESDGGSTLSW